MRRLARLLPLALPLVACAPATGPAAVPTPAFVVAPTPAPDAPTPAPSAAVAAPLTPAVTTIAGGDDEGYLDGPGAQARFNTPLGLAVGADGDLYVADSQNHRIRRIDLDDPGFRVSTVAGGGQVPAPGEVLLGAYADGTGSTARFFEPSGLVAAPDGSLYIADAFNHRVRRAVPGTPGWQITTIAGSGKEASEDGLGTEASFRVPFGLALAASGDLFVSDHWGQVVRRIADPTGKAAVTTIAGRFDTPGYLDKPGAAARFQFPAGLALDAKGNLYVLEAKGCHLRRIEPDATVLTLNDLAQDACGYQDGNLEGGRLDGARLLATLPGAAGFVMLAGDEGNQVVRRIDVVNDAGDGTIQTVGGPDAGFVKPRGIAVAKDGFAYVADNHRIRRLKL